MGFFSFLLLSTVLGLTTWLVIAEFDRRLDR